MRKLAAVLALVALCVLIRQHRTAQVSPPAGTIEAPSPTLPPLPAATTPPPRVDEPALDRELAAIRRHAAGVRRGPMDPRAHASAIAAYCGTRAGVFERLFERDPDGASRLLDAALAESDTDLRLPLARLLRPGSTIVRARLLALAASGQPDDVRAVALAALGSRPDPDVHAALDAAARHDTTESLRLHAVDSLASFPADHAASDVTLRAVLECDPAPTVRVAVVHALASRHGDQALPWLRSRLDREQDPDVLAAIRSCLPEEK